MIFGT